MSKKSFFESDYQAPVSESRYMKLKEGENRIRILAPALSGYEMWVEGKPLRKKKADQFTSSERNNADINKLSKTKSIPKNFLAFPVYNFDEQKVQILQLSQVSIINALVNLFNDEDWGDPQEYGVAINRKESNKVSYSVTPKPKKELSEEVIAAWKEVQSEGFDLKKMLTGENPFGTGTSTVTAEDDEESTTEEEVETDNF